MPYWVNNIDPIYYGALIYNVFLKECTCGKIAQKFSAVEARIRIGTPFTVSLFPAMPFPVSKQIGSVLNKTAINKLCTYSWLISSSTLLETMKFYCFHTTSQANHQVWSSSNSNATLYFSKGVLNGRRFGKEVHAPQNDMVQWFQTFD